MPFESIVSSGKDFLVSPQTPSPKAPSPTSAPNLSPDSLPADAGSCIAGSLSLFLSRGVMQLLLKQTIQGLFFPGHYKGLVRTFWITHTPNSWALRPRGKGDALEIFQTGFSVPKRAQNPPRLTDLLNPHSIELLEEFNAIGDGEGMLIFLVRFTQITKKLQPFLHVLDPISGSEDPNLILGITKPREESGSGLGP